MRRTSSSCGILALLGTLLLATPAWSGVDTLGQFELDGDATEASGTPGDDWSTLYGGAGSQFVFTGIKHDPDPETIFTGGRKDIQPISQWAHKSGSVPDKDEIADAYATAYDADGDLVVYFGADRISNVGDAYLGFWFFKGEVKANPDGSFSGEHELGDALVLVNFPQGANAEPLVQVVEWDTSCSKAASNNPVAGECAASNLRLLASNSGSGALCGSGAGPACAITNEGTVASPWPYTSKDGYIDQFPYETFFEGGINLSDILGDVCFSSFLAETRSSSSFTASLKDFVWGKFAVCGIEITKNCTDTDLNAAETAFVNTFSGTVTNTGFGTLYDVTVTDVTGGQTFNLGSLATQESKPYGGTFESTANPATNYASVAAATSPGAAKNVTAGPVNAECPGMALSPVIDVTKQCSTRLAAVEGQVVLFVDYSGQVCNITGTGADGPIGLRNVTATDDAGTPDDQSDDTTYVIGNLAAGQCKPYGGSYAPAGVNSGSPSAANFSDTVTAGGEANLGFGTVADIATANCPVCE